LDYDPDASGALWHRALDAQPGTQKPRMNPFFSHFFIHTSNSISVTYKSRLQRDSGISGISVSPGSKTRRHSFGELSGPFFTAKFGHFFIFAILARFCGN
jgi:hypothetical protein